MRKKMTKVKCPRCGHEHFIDSAKPFFGDPRICTECGKKRVSYTYVDEDEGFDD